MITDFNGLTFPNLTDEENDDFSELVSVFNYHYNKNQQKEKYYEGNISLSSVNLGIALPELLNKLEIGCAWGAKTVDVLAAKSRFDGFVGLNGQESEQLNQIVFNNNLIEEYAKATRDELKFGCTFATLAKNAEGKASVRFHSPKTAAALWDGVRNRIRCGFAIIDTVPDESQKNTWVPSLINYYRDNSTIVFERVREGNWIATIFPHKMGRPMMEAFVWNATSNKPFGRSRIKEPVRRLIDGYVRTIANATIGLEFATSPQKYLLGITDDQYDQVINKKFQQYVGSIIASTTNPETGSNPAFGQLSQGSLTPHVDMLRLLSTQFSAATGLSVTDTGVINEANPTSSDALIVQTQTLIGMAEELNVSNGNSLRIVGLMAYAIENNKSLDELTVEEFDIVAHFKNPTMASISQTADAAVKIASQRPGFAQTDVFLEMMGFDAAEIRRIKAQEQYAQGLETLQQMGVE